MTHDASRTRPSTTELTGLAIRGFAMGSADVVPGVSGGTVALVTGIYPAARCRHQYGIAGRGTVREGGSARWLGSRQEG